MGENDTRSPKTPQQIEDELMEFLRQAQLQWSIASGNNNRDAARQQFIKSLHTFNGSFLDKKDPEEA